MTEIETLVRQTSNAYEWVNKLLAEIPLDKWDHSGCDRIES